MRYSNNDERIALIDIGSNSIRLVMYDSYGRYPYPLFDERVTAKLGRGIDESGQLNMSRIKSALQALSRFALLLEPLKAEHVVIMATAAVRRARNAEQFLEPATKILNHDIQVISSREEAELMVQGLTSHMPHITGLIVDLGGGSTEIAYVEHGEIIHATSIPIGHLSNISEKMVRQYLTEISWLKDLNVASLYGIGGSFRAIGNVFLSETNYPVQLLHRLQIPSRKTNRILKKLMKGEPLTGVPYGRLGTIPMASTIMHALFGHSSCSELIISGTSIRDGMLAKIQQNIKTEKDILITVCKELSRHTQRFVGEGKALYKLLHKTTWQTSKQLLSESEIVNSKRLLKAVCLLSNICWREPQENRGRIAFERILALPVYGLSHKERVWMGKVLFHRYNGVKKNLRSITSAETLLTKEEKKHALTTGLGLRFAAIFCAGNIAFLEGASLTIKKHHLIFAIEAQHKDLLDFHSARRLETFGNALGLKPKVIFHNPKPSAAMPS